MSRALAPAVNAMILLAFSALVFVRIGYVYPSRTPVLRTLTIAGRRLAWGALLLVIVLALPERRTGCSRCRSRIRRTTSSSRWRCSCAGRPRRDARA